MAEPVSLFHSPAKHRALARLGFRMSPAEVRMAKRRNRDEGWKWYGRLVTRRGRFKQCRCRRWFLCRLSYVEPAHTFLGREYPDRTITLECLRCRECKAAKVAARRRRDYATKRARRREARTGLLCLVCRKPLPAQRRTRRYCCGATCRQRAYRVTLRDGGGLAARRPVA
jgi:hypothetical protein